MPTVASLRQQWFPIAVHFVGRSSSQLVLRLLRGESVGAVSREPQVPAHEIDAWRRTFLEGWVDGLKDRHRDSEARLLTRAQAKVGDLVMRMELARCYSQEAGTRRSWRG